MPRYSVKFRGLDEVKRNLGVSSSMKMKRNIDDDLDEGIHDMAETSSDMAPVETGALKASILASVRKVSRHKYMYGSHLPYAQRQEYEHDTKKGYFRRSVYKEAPQIYSKIRTTIKRNLNG